MPRKPDITLLYLPLPETRPVFEDGRILPNIVELAEIAVYLFDVDGANYQLTIYPGFRFSSSIPWGFRWLLGSPCDPESLCYSLPHDAIYQTHCLPKEIADCLLDEIAEDTGMVNWKSSLIYRGVKWFGGKSWNSVNLLAKRFVSLAKNAN